jgi:hypothetical protein
VVPYGIQTDIYSIPDLARPYSSSLENPIPNPFPFRPVEPGGHFNFASVAPIGLTFMDPYFRTPYGQQWNLQVQYELLRGWQLDVGYVGSRGVKLLSRREWNPGIPGPGATSGNIHSRRVYNQGNPQNEQFNGAVFGSLTNQLSDANSNYHGLQAQMTKRFAGGLSLTNAFTWGHAIDNASGLRSRSRIDSLRADRGSSDHDIRYRYTASYTYELPFLKGSTGMLQHVLAGWGVSGVTTFQSGLPFNVTEPQDRCLCGSGSGADVTNRPDYLGGTVTFYDPRRVDAVAGRANSYFDGTGAGNPTAATSPFFRRVGSAATWAAGAGRYGNFGRNVFHGPGINNWDVNVFKNFRVAEGHSLRFTTGFFNAFNHVQFKNPNGDIGSANFGRVTTEQGPRVMQMSLTYQF